MDDIIKTYKNIKEEAPANNIGSGNIAGAGVGPSGEPGMTSKSIKKYKAGNKNGMPRKSFKAWLGDNK